MITAESRDFNVATYSVASFTGTAFASTTFTGIPGGALACGFRAEFPEQDSAIALAAKPATRKPFALYLRKLFFINQNPRPIKQPSFGIFPPCPEPRWTGLYNQVLLNYDRRFYPNNNDFHIGPNWPGNRRSVSPVDHLPQDFLHDFRRHRCGHSRHIPHRVELHHVRPHDLSLDRVQVSNCFPYPHAAGSAIPASARKR